MKFQNFKTLWKMWLCEILKAFAKKITEIFFQGRNFFDWNLDKMFKLFSFLNFCLLKTQGWSFCSEKILAVGVTGKTGLRIIFVRCQKRRINRCMKPLLISRLNLRFSRDDIYVDFLHSTQAISSAVALLVLLS